MVLRAYNPTASVQEVKEGVQWDLKIDDNVKPLESPGEEELHILREQVDPGGMYLREARLLSDREVVI